MDHYPCHLHDNVSAYTERIGYLWMTPTDKAGYDNEGRDANRFSMFDDSHIRLVA